MKNPNSAPVIVINAIKTIVAGLHAAEGMNDPETGKPILNRSTMAKLPHIDRLMQAINTGKRLPVNDQVQVLNACLHVSVDMSGKLEGVNAISTACSVNPICKNRAKDCNSICAHCFAMSTLARYDGLQQAAIINFVILNAYEYSKAAWKAVCIPCSAAGDMFRIEAFGDCASTVQAINYSNLASTHKRAGMFGIWSKNLAYWARAFEQTGKPRNIVFNASSPVLNVPMQVPARFAWFVDHVFTVYDAAGAIAAGVEITCGDRICAHCRRCYTAGNGPAVNEILKSDSKRYYKAIGKEYAGRR